MKISVAVKPGAREDKVEQVSVGEFKVAVKEPPVEGRANRAAARLLAEHFGVSAARVRIVAGRTSRRKILEITGA